MTYDKNFYKLLIIMLFSEVSTEAVVDSDQNMFDYLPLSHEIQKCTI